MREEAIHAEWRRRRRLASELYRPEAVHLVIVGEAPPPERFFYFGDSLFFRYLMRAFVPFTGEAVAADPGWFLAMYRALGGWRTDVCVEPQRASKGGADDIGDCLEAFLERWNALPFIDDPLVIGSPKRLYEKLPPQIQRQITATVPPPGQWNAHRVAFLREMERLLAAYVGRDVIVDAMRSVDKDDATLDFEIARACAEGVDSVHIQRMLKGHPREEVLTNAWLDTKDKA